VLQHSQQTLVISKDCRTLCRTNHWSVVKLKVLFNRRNAVVVSSSKLRGILSGLLAVGDSAQVHVRALQFQGSGHTRSHRQPNRKTISREVTNLSLNSTKYDSRCARGRPRMADDLDAIKFLCKEFWGHVFQKQVDNLKTNHRVLVIPPSVYQGNIQGVYVLQDNNFRWMAHINSAANSEVESPARSRLLQQYLALPCGLIKGLS